MDFVGGINGEPIRLDQSRLSIILSYYNVDILLVSFISFSDVFPLENSSQHLFHWIIIKISSYLFKLRFEFFEFWKLSKFSQNSLIFRTFRIFKVSIFQFFKFLQFRIFRIRKFQNFSALKLTNSPWNAFNFLRFWILEILTSLRKHRIFRALKSQRNCTSPNNALT